MLKRFSSIVAAASLLFASGVALSQGQPAQWKYSIPGGVSTATYPGNTVVQGTQTQAGPVNINPGPLKVGDPSVNAKLVGVFQNGGTTGADSPTVSIIRQTSHTGGTPFVTNNALYVATNVVAGVTDFEWPLLSVVNNYATAGQNSAIYTQGNKMVSGAGPTWGGTIELRELVPINNPVSGSIGLELNVSANGTDATNQRVGADFVCRRYDTGGPDTQCGYGFRVQSGGSTTHAVTTTAFGVIDRAVVGFDTSAATIVQAAIKVGSQQPIAFDAGAINKLYYDGSTGLAYDNGGIKFTIRSNGTIQFVPVLFSGLPTCNAGMKGAVAVIADSPSPTYNANAAGGGTDTIQVICNGTNWKNG